MTKLSITALLLTLTGCSTISEEEVLSQYAWEARSDRSQQARPFEDELSVGTMQGIIAESESIEQVCQGFEAQHLCPSGSTAHSRVRDDEGPLCEVFCRDDGVIADGMFVSYRENPVPTIEKGPMVEGKRSGAWSTLVELPSNDELAVTEVAHFRGGILDGEKTAYLPSGTAFEKKRFINGKRETLTTEQSGALYGGL